MRSESPLFQIVSLLMLVGPIYLFWHIDWYWIVGYYNLFFTYSAITLYKSYNRDSNYRRKYHPIIYFGLPLILNFVGFLISLLNGFEEIRDGDSDFKSDKKESKEEDEAKENEDKNYLEIIKSKIQEAIDIRQKLIDNKLTIRITYGGLWKAEFQFNEAFKNYGESAEFLKHSMIYNEETEPFDYNDLENSDIITFNKGLSNNKNLKTFSGEIEICEVLKIPKENLIMTLNEYINNPDDEISYDDTSWEDFLTYDWDYPEFKDPDIDIDDCTLGYNGPRIADCLLGLEQGMAGGSENYYIEQIWENEKADIQSLTKKLYTEKDLIQELGSIYGVLDSKEYKKKAFDLWRDFFLKKYDESEEKDGWEIGQEAYSIMFDMYEVAFVSFFYNHKDSGDTGDHLDIGFPIKYTDNGKPALIYNFPFKYDEITSHSGGSIYQLDDVWGSLNEVCKSLSELEIIDFEKLSQNEKIKLFKPQRNDYD